MRKRWVWVIFAVVVLAVGVLAVATREREPEYGGSVFEGGNVWAGTPYPAIPGQFNQFGGTVKIMNLGLYYNYSLDGKRRSVIAN